MLIKFAPKAHAKIVKKSRLKCAVYYRTAQWIWKKTAHRTRRTVRLKPGCGLTVVLSATFCILNHGCILNTTNKIGIFESTCTIISSWKHCISKHCKTLYFNIVFLNRLPRLFFNKKPICGNHIEIYFINL